MLTNDNDTMREMIKYLIDADNVTDLKNAFSHYLLHLVEEVNYDNREERMTKAMQVFDRMKKMEDEFYSFKSELIGFSTTAADLA